MHGEFSWHTSPSSLGTNSPTLLLGDCLSEMRKLPDASIDFAYIGLPYQTTDCRWDVKIDLTRMWKQLHRVVKPGSAVCFLADRVLNAELFMSNRQESKFEYIWIKPQGTTPRRWERTSSSSGSSSMGNLNGWGTLMDMNEFDALRNAIERQMEARYPGYHGSHYGVLTETNPFIGFDDIEEFHVPQVETLS